MSETCHIQEDNISIQIDPAIFDKPDSQLTEQLYQMARRIAESDRNNEAYRQAKKSKSFQLQTLKHNKQELQSQLERLEGQIKNKKSMENQNTFSKNNRVKFQEINSMCQNFGAREKQVQKNTCQILKQNEKLEKKLAVLQVEYDIMVKQNKHKSIVAAKLMKQKQQKLLSIQKNNEAIAELQNQCESTKRRAEDLQSQLKEELKNEEELEEIIRQRQSELQTQRKNREQTNRKQEQNKKYLLKMVSSVKTMESEIEQKFKEGQKLQNIHENLRQKINQMESQQKKLQQFVMSRKNMLSSLKQISGRASKQEQSLLKLKISKQKEDE